SASVHVDADDVLLVRLLRPVLLADLFLALSRRARLHVARADGRIGLRQRIVVPAALAHVAEDATAARPVPGATTAVRRGHTAPAGTAAPAAGSAIGTAASRATTTPRGGGVL